jgi:hypothetical protein
MNLRDQTIFNTMRSLFRLRTGSESNGNIVTIEFTNPDHAEAFKTNLLRLVYTDEQSPYVNDSANLIHNE